MHTLWIKWWCWQSMITYSQRCPVVYRSYIIALYVPSGYAYFRIGRKCQSGFIFCAHCQSCTVRLHVRADFIFPVFSPLGHDKRISSSRFRLPFRMSVHDFSNERERACWDCWVTWRYNRIARRALTFNIFPSPLLRRENSDRRNRGKMSDFGDDPGKITSSKFAPEITRAEHR